MKVKQSFLTFALATLGIVAIPSVSSAQTFTVTPSSDAEVNSATIASVAEGRIGDLLGAATFEVDLGQNTAQPVQKQQFNWSNGTALPFVVTYNGSQFTYKVGGNPVLNYTPTTPFTTIYIRTNAVKTGSSVAVASCTLNGESLPLLALSSVGATSPQVKVFKITGLSSNQPFTLSCLTQMDWQGQPQVLGDQTAPHQSQLSYQVKVGQ